MEAGKKEKKTFFIIAGIYYVSHREALSLKTLKVPVVTNRSKT